MSSSFATFIANEVAIAFGIYGEAVTYTPPSGSAPDPFNAIVSEGFEDADNDAMGKRYQRRAIIDLPASYTIDEAGTFTIGGEVWQILQQDGADADVQTWKIVIPRNKSIRKPKTQLN